MISIASFYSDTSGFEDLLMMSIQKVNAEMDTEFVSAGHRQLLGLWTTAQPGR